MEKRSIKDIKQGDIISLDNSKSKVVFKWKIMRQNDMYEVYVYDIFSGIFVAPNAVVRVYGKSDNVNLWDADERQKYALKMWNELKHKLPTQVINMLEGVCGGRLFGKRGRYSLTEKDCFIRNYKRMVKLQNAIKEHKGVVDANVRVYDDMENLEYSIAMESECYGHRNYYITLICKDGQQLSI